MNILLLIVLIVLICNVVEGYKKGMVKSVISFVSLIITCIVAILLGNALKSYMDGEIFNVVVLIILLCIIGILRHLLDVVFFSAKVISKLPVVSWVNKLLGIVFGFLETILMIWTIYTFVMLLDLGVVEQMVLDSTAESQVLSWMYQHNYLAYLVEQVSSQISF